MPFLIQKTNQTKTTVKFRRFRVRRENIFPTNYTEPHVCDTLTQKTTCRELTSRATIPDHHRWALVHSLLAAYAHPVHAPVGRALILYTPHFLGRIPIGRATLVDEQPFFLVNFPYNYPARHHHACLPPEPLAIRDEPSRPALFDKIPNFVQHIQYNTTCQTPPPSWPHSTPQPLTSRHAP